MATNGKKTQKEHDQGTPALCDQIRQTPSTDSENSFCAFCAFCGEPALLAKSHPILKKAEHHVHGQNDRPTANFAKASIINIDAQYYRTPDCQGQSRMSWPSM